MKNCSIIVFSQQILLPDCLTRSISLLPNFPRTGNQDFLQDRFLDWRSDLRLNRFLDCLQD